MKPSQTFEEQIDAEIPDAKVKIAAAIKAGTFVSLDAFYEQHRPLSADELMGGEPDTLPQAIKMLAQLRASVGSQAERLSNESQVPILDATLKRAENAESALARAEKRLAELESAERSSPLGEQLAAMTLERDQAIDEKKRSDKTLALMEGLCGVRGVDPSAAVPSESVVVANTTMADYERRIREAKDPAARAAIAKEFMGAVVKGTVKL